MPAPIVPAVSGLGKKVWRRKKKPDGVGPDPVSGELTD